MWARRLLPLLLIVSGCASQAAPPPPPPAALASAAARRIEAVASCEGARVQGASWSTDGHLVALHLDASVRVLETEKWQTLMTAKFARPVEKLVFSADRRYLFSVTTQTEEPYARELIVFRVPDGERMWQGRIADGERSLAIAADSSWFAAVIADPPDPDGYQTTWHAELVSIPLFTARKLSQPAHTTQLPRPAWHPRKVPRPEGHASANGMETVLPISNGPADYSLDLEVPGKCCEVLASGDSRTLAVSYEDVTSVVDVQEGAVVSALVGAAPTFSPSGRWLVLGRKSGSVTLFDTRKRHGTLIYDALCDVDLARLGPPPDFNADESLLALGGYNPALCLVSTARGKVEALVPRELPTPTPQLEHGRSAPGGFSSDGSAIVSVGPFAQSLFRVDSGEYIEIKNDDGLYAWFFVRRADDSLIAFDMNRRPLVEVLGHHLEPLPEPHDDCGYLELSPDGEKGLHASNGVQTLCSTRSFQPVATFTQKDGYWDFDPSSRFVHGTHPRGFSVFSATNGRRLFHLEYCEPRSR